MSSWRGQTAQGPLAAATNVPSSSSAQQEQNNNGPRAKCDQVVFEAIAKAAEIVVGSRCWIENVPGSNSSSRFNLLVPEVQGVRSILHRWKRSLHVPLRLDVFYQHDDGRRELLERWCLEYAPKTTYSFQHNVAAADPIVQLRQVCKSIVVWLRTLYGWSRMLPAQALRQRQTLGTDNHVGFSIYVVSEGNDDVTGLISNQGFLSQGQPHSVLTPYGELGWKVFYAPDSMVQQLVPEVPKYSIAIPTAIRTASQPIPMKQQMNAAQTYANPNHHIRMSPQQQQQELSAARSAPNKQRSPGYYRSNSDVDGYHQPRKVPPIMSNAMRRNSDLPILHQNGTHMSQQQQQQQQEQLQHQEQSFPQQSPTSQSNPPTKNLSALSLAMLMNNNTENANADGETREAAEKRRAALHHAPPQFSNNNQNNVSTPPPPPGSSPALKPSNLATAGEYGYGYNNQLPNMAGPPSSPATTTRGVLDGRGSPGPLSGTSLSSTPTTGFLLGTAPTPPGAVPGVSTLIPPRSTSVTPPFVRPAGFVGEPPSQPFLPPSAAAAMVGTPPTGEFKNQQHSRNHQTSLDLLHSSPFQRPTASPNLDDELRQAFNLNDLMPPDIGTGFMNPRTRPDEFYYDNHHGAFGQSLGDDDDMPFAVDSYTTSSHGEKRSSGNGIGSSLEATSNLLLSSANGMASICSTAPRRLALFDSVATNTTTSNTAPGPNQSDGAAGAIVKAAEGGMTMSLADELAEFKTFGASLMMDGKASQSSSNSTPIALRP
ncbi:unnamed protein product [Cylindrotheca closterium]|uniref:Autophagy-related protein 13 N-terminal domain-containing protein n=1 Tax=Cylindrotheca closterium TaxID=2856 RepID=A0AAD2PVD5_9STRA|nr:unnamed protein product [Cylindrotheca closterium]